MKSLVNGAINLIKYPHGALKRRGIVLLVAEAMPRTKKSSIDSQDEAFLLGIKVYGVFTLAPIRSSKRAHTWDQIIRTGNNPSKELANNAVTSLSGSLGKFADILTLVAFAVIPAIANIKRSMNLAPMPRIGWVASKRIGGVIGSGSDRKW